MNWIFREPGRFLRERKALDDLVCEFTWMTGIHWRIDKDTLNAVVDIDIEIHGRVREVDMTYPEAFPNTPPYIRPRDRSQRWSAHQYGEGGSFCLEWRADNWHPDISGADLLRSLYRLLSTEQHPEGPVAVPSAHALTLGQEVRAADHRLVVSPALMEKLAALPTDVAVPINTRTILHYSATICFILDIGTPSGTLEPLTDIPEGIRAFVPLAAWKGSGFVLRLRSFDSSINITNAQQLMALIDRLGFSGRVALEQGPSKTLSDVLVILVADSAAQIQCWGIDDGQVHEYVHLPGAEFGKRLPPSHSQLKEKRIAIVGLGSIGSKVTISLARSGCRKFLLVDDDVFLPENLCRGELSWAAVGLHKSEAVKEALRLIAPGIETDVRLTRLAGQESSIVAASALKALSSCDLIIDATAQPEVFTLLASVAKLNRRTLCWGEIFAGGIGGLIARASPLLGPTPLVVRNGILNHLSQLPPAPYVNATRYDVPGEEPLVADDADVTHVASVLSGVALDALLERSPTAFPYPAYLLGLRNEWVFSGAFDTHPIDVERDSWDTQMPDDDNRATAIAALIGILKDTVDDHTDSAAANPGHDQNSAA